MNDEIAVGLFDSHDLKLAATFVVSDPTESGLVRVGVVVMAAAVMAITK